MKLFENYYKYIKKIFPNPYEISGFRYFQNLLLYTRTKPNCKLVVLSFITKIAYQSYYRQPMEISKDSASSTNRITVIETIITNTVNCISELTIKE